MADLTFVMAAIVTSMRPATTFVLALLLIAIVAALLIQLAVGLTSA